MHNTHSPPETTLLLQRSFIEDRVSPALLHKCLINYLLWRIEGTMADLKEFGENLWTVDGPIVRDMGIHFHLHRMQIIVMLKRNHLRAE